LNAVALVTGASRGIGAATALALAEQGCDLAINCLTQREKADQVAAQVRAMGRQAIVIQADVADYDQVQQMVAQTVAQLGGLHVLVNNAGYSSHGTLDQLTPDAWRRMVGVTLDGAFFCAKAAAPHMRTAGWGRIVNVCSLRAMTGSDHGSHYASAKAGLIGLTKSLALELAPQVLVNGICPGFTATDMNRKALEAKGAEIRAKIPLQRVAEPRDIACVIAFLCSEGMNYVTGETINVNGGVYMR